MYRKDSEGWIKHLDFIILDLICLQIAFILAYAFSGYGINPYTNFNYRNMAVFIEMADLLVMFEANTMKNVLKQDFYRGFVLTERQGVTIGALSLVYLFMLQRSHSYSRLALVLTIIIDILLTYQ